MGTPPTITNEGTTIPAGLTRPFSHNVVEADSWFYVEGGKPFENGSVNRIGHYNAVQGPTGGNGSLNDGKRLNFWRASVLTDAPKLAFGVAPVTAAVKYRFLVDGQYADLTGIGTTATTGLTREYLQLDFAGVRKLRMITIEGDRTCAIKQLQISLFDRLQKPNLNKPKVVWLGDSYPEGAAATLYSNGIAPQLGDYLGVSIQAAGVGATGWVQTVSPVYTFGQRLADLSLMGEPDMVILQASLNDRLQNATDVQAACAAFLPQVRTLLPNSVICVIGAFPGALTPAAVSGTENAVKAAFASWADPNSFFVPISTVSIASTAAPWVDGTGKVGGTNGSGNSDFYTASDGVHLSDPAGTDYSARMLAQAIINGLKALN